MYPLNNKGNIINFIFYCYSENEWMWSFLKSLSKSTPNPKIFYLNAIYLISVPSKIISIYIFYWITSKSYKENEKYISKHRFCRQGCWNKTQLARVLRENRNIRISQNLFKSFLNKTSSKENLGIETLERVSYIGLGLAKVILYDESS